MPENLSILGASARAAAASAARAGFVVTAVDLFADTDTRQIANTIRIGDYPDDFFKVAEHLPQGPWLYTGGLENYPDLVDALAAHRPLWGNAGAVLRAVRDPLQWPLIARDAGLPTPSVARDFRDVPRDGSWLAKPLRSSAGFGIRLVDEAFELPAATRGDYYFQQRVPGMPASLVFVAARRMATLLGATEQLCGTAWSGATAFLYAGSIGPLVLLDDITASVARCGTVLAEALDLTGLFGIDGIVNDEGFWPIEINPRYVASIEILERGYGANFLQFHANACQWGLIPFVSYDNRLLHGKVIVYATWAARFGTASAQWVERMNDHYPWPMVADIPNIGESFAIGDPVVTVLASGETRDDVAAQLQARRDEALALLDP